MNSNVDNDDNDINIRDSSIINEDMSSISSLEYTSLLEEAKQLNFSDLENSHCIQIIEDYYTSSTSTPSSTPSSSGRNNYPIILFIPELALNKTQSMTIQLKRLVLYYLKVTHKVSLTSYILIYAHTNLSILSQNTLIQQFHKTLPITIRKNLKKLYLLHPTFLIKLFYDTAAKWFLSQKFYRKLSFYDTIRDFQISSNLPSIIFPSTFIKNEDLTLGYKPMEFLPSLTESFDTSLGTTKLLFLCINYLRQINGIRSKGLFRLAGDRILEELVKTRLCHIPKNWEEYVIIGDYNSNNRINITSTCPLSRVIVDDIDTIGCIIKMSLRDLPEPLIPFEYYDYLMKITMQLDHGIDRLSWEEIINRTIASLPFVNSSTLSFLLSFLAEVAAESAENNMDSDNLGRIFAPTLFRPLPVELQPQSQTQLSPPDPMMIFVEVNLQKTILKHLISVHMNKNTVLKLSTINITDRMLSRLNRGNSGVVDDDNVDNDNIGNNNAINTSSIDTEDELSLKKVQYDNKLEDSFENKEIDSETFERRCIVSYDLRKNQFKLSEAYTLPNILENNQIKENDNEDNDLEENCDDKDNNFKDDNDNNNNNNNNNNKAENLLSDEINNNYDTNNDPQNQNQEIEQESEEVTNDIKEEN